MFKPIKNPPSPFQSHSYEWLDVPPEANLELFEETAKSIITQNNSPDVGFSFSVNPYRGCFHACAYCYARPTHQYLDYGAGSDFERKLIVKVNAPELLQREFDKRSWQGDEVVYSGITDCYQPIEDRYELTRRCLQVCAKYQNPVTIITKSALVTRDIDVLQDLHRRASVRVFISIPFADDEISKLVEPGAPRSSRRFRAMRELTDAGIRTGLAIAPVIPGLSDHAIAELLERARDAGADSAFITLLRLPAEVKDVFVERIEGAFPSRAKKIIHGIQELRNGKLNNSEFGSRMTGEGERWKAVEWLFEQTCERLGLNKRASAETSDRSHTTFRRPNPQLSLPGF
ncbi:MAG: PA0069 family radical SAM protein [Bdellovibrionota bacterium]